MPSGYAHYRFGTMLLPTMPGDVRRTIQRFRSLFDMGLHGPDFFYYYGPVLKSSSGFLGIKFHEQSGREFFTRVCRMLRMEKSEAGIAYLYGLLCHYCLDSVCHPYVIGQTAQGTATHVEIETEFDRFLLETDGKAPSAAQNLSRHMTLTPGELDTVARFYPPANARNIRDSIRSMAFFTRLLASGEGAKRKMLEMSLGLSGKEFKGMLIPLKPNPACQSCNEVLLSLYEKAAAQLPEMLTQLQAHMTYSAPFEDQFSLPFGGSDATEVSEVTP